MIHDVRFESGFVTRLIVERGALGQLHVHAREAGLEGTAGLLCDARLLAVQRDAILALGKHFGDPLARPVSEARKSLAEVEAMCEVLVNRGVQRDGYVVAVGGGVLTDLAGLAAALHLRGIPWISVPTTLLAQVDAGLGGKTGANLRAGKNLVGAFHQPRLVVCDPDVLRTLPPRELWSGLAEVVKCALIEGGELLERCEEALDLDALQPLIEGAVKLKARLVAEDEREGGARAFLNLGHTVGHALESATQYGHFTHGEGVALGLRGMLHLSRARGMPDADRALKLVERLQVAVDRQLDHELREAALQAMTHDKKARGGEVRFVLLRRIGEPYVDKVSANECRAALGAALA